MDNSTIVCYEIIESYAKDDKAACKTHNFYILRAFLLITIASLIAVCKKTFLLLSDKISSKTKTFITISLQKIKNKSILIV